MALGGLAAAAALPRAARAQITHAERDFDLGGGVRVHGVASAGAGGSPVVFVHGSLSDFTYWGGQLAMFAGHNDVVAYSRRYNWPNRNAPVAGYSAVVDAQDLAALIEGLKAGPAHIVGHSYGALTALFLAVRRPDLVKSLSLGEPPAVSLLAHLSGEDAARGQAMFDDIGAHMIAPMRAAFGRGDREAGVAAFIDYVRGAGTWAGFSAQDKAETLKDAVEWDVMMTTGTLFPELPPEAVRRIKAPTQLLSGAKSYPFLGVIDAELARLIPGARRLIFPDANHQMWLQQPEACRAATFRNMGRAP
jgi:pimeloyl-ACP methyl ester carboxylesterase